MRHQKKAAQPPKRRRRGGQTGEIFRPETFRRTDHIYGFALSRSPFAPVCVKFTLSNRT